MRRFVTVAVLLVATASLALAQQFSVIAEHNAYTTKNGSPLPDSLKPYFNDQGVRGIWLTTDLDKDGKQEILATDYSNGGRVHVFEWTSGDTLELVWSSPRFQSSNPNSTPRWVRQGDLDGDGNPEIIFPVGTYNGGEIEVYEWDGTDNGYGTAPILTLPATQFTGVGTGTFYMHRETALVQDVDGDGRDELITANSDKRAYILGVAGEFPGFGAWQIEGGDPAVETDPSWAGGSWWQATFADINGDGKKEIVNHHYDNYAFWSIDPLGTDTYRYPRIADGKPNYYHQYLPVDGVAYLGLTPVDVDGDGKDELAGILYATADAKYHESVGLVSLARTDTGVYVWRDSTQFGQIGTRLWTLAGKTSGEHWAIAAYDFNGNGRQEVLVGGFADYNVISLEYKGTGSILDEANYEKKVTYPGDPARYVQITYTTDTLGVTDTSYAESPFLTRILAGSDINHNGQKEMIVAYQSIADQVTHIYQHWTKNSLGVDSLVSDSTVKTPNVNAVNFKILEYTGTSGFSSHDMAIVTPDDYTLDQNYPNPFNPSTTIRFTLPVDKKVSVVVYDMLGREVKTLIANEMYHRGSHQITWNGTDDHNRPVSSGSYIYTLKYGNFSKSAKMTLLK